MTTPPYIPPQLLCRCRWTRQMPREPQVRIRHEHCPLHRPTVKAT